MPTLSDEQIRRLKAYLSLKKGDINQTTVLQLTEILGTLLNQYQQAKGDKGDRGEKGDKGERGEKGDRGIKGDKGDMGKRGAEGPQGPQGIDGQDGKDGKNGVNGKDGKSVDIVEFINKIKNDKKFLETLKGEKGDKGESGETIVRQFSVLGGRGTNLQVLANGVNIGQTINRINFTGTGILATRNSDNSITINVAGGTSSWNQERPSSGAVNGSNTDFVFDHTPGQITLEGQILEKGVGKDYTVSGNTITLTTSPVSGGNPPINNYLS